MKYMKLSNNPAKYEVLIKQYLRSVLDISGWLAVGSPCTIVALPQLVTLLLLVSNVPGQFYLLF